MTTEAPPKPPIIHPNIIDDINDIGLDPCDVCGEPCNEKCDNCGTVVHIWEEGGSHSKCFLEHIRE